MSQFGADTTIEPGVRLLILDCFDTLVELEGERYRPRLGVDVFLRHYGTRLGIPLVVASDAEQGHVERVLEQSGLAAGWTAIHAAPGWVEQLPDGRLLKRLDRVLAAHGVVAADGLFIGDSPLDALAAQRFGLPFIRVPGSADRDFSFARLIAGPSRYHSAEYTTRMLRRYGPQTERQEPPDQEPQP